MKGRIRTIKPELALDEELWRVCQMMPTEPVLQVYQMLWCYADREERFEWRPMALRAVCVPYYTGDISIVLDLLLKFGFLQKYRVEGKDYGIVRNLKKHQRFNSREPKSTIPCPTSIADFVDTHARTRTHAHAQEEMELEGNGNGNGTGSGMNREPVSESHITTTSESIHGSEVPIAGPIYEVSAINSGGSVVEPGPESSGSPKPRLDKITLIAPADFEPTQMGYAYARAHGLTESQIVRCIAEVQATGQRKRKTPYHWDSIWNDYVEKRIKWNLEDKEKDAARKSGAPLPVQLRQPNSGEFDYEQYRPENNPDEPANRKPETT